MLSDEYFVGRIQLFIISAQCVLHIRQLSYEMYRICDLD